MDGQCHPELAGGDHLHDTSLNGECQGTMSYVSYMWEEWSGYNAP